VGTAFSVSSGASSFIVDSAGKVWWGSFDTNLYRSAAGVLKTDGVLQAGPRVQVRGDGTGGDILFGGSAATFDAAIYRSASRELAVDGVGGATAWLKVSADITARYSGSGGVGVMIGDIGSARSGMLLGASGDTNLYRSAVGTLRTDTDIDVGRDLSIRRNLYANITAGGVTGSITNKIQVWNANTGAYVGVIPIYNA
jgi:hypothetical protein